MRRIVLVCAALAAACNLEMVGLAELDAQLVRARTVVLTECDPDTLSVAAGDVGGCIALNPDSATIAQDGRPVVLWRTSNPAIAQVDLGGAVMPSRPGTVVITAIGAQGSQASDTVVVVE